jgi:hypothetical protein
MTDPLRLLGAVLSAAIFAVALAVPAQAQHPTAVTSIVNSSADTTLEVNYSGGLLMPGKLGDITNYTAPNDSTPATGAGTRMMWYPEKAALRAGRVFDNSGSSGNSSTGATSETPRMSVSTPSHSERIRGPVVRPQWPWVKGQESWAKAPRRWDV